MLTDSSLAGAPEPIFDAYRRVIADQVRYPSSAWSFKSDPAVRQFFEHATAAEGAVYLELVRAMPQWNTLAERVLVRTAMENDARGRPYCSAYPQLGGLACSPTNLRYVWQAMTLWAHVERLNLGWPVHVIEIGGGYGGLALYAQRFAPWFSVQSLSHWIVDVPEAGPLQKAYVAQFEEVSVQTCDGSSAEAIAAMLRATSDAPRLLVSCYGFSEFSAEVRAWYEQHLTPHCPHGFLVWNRTPVHALVDAPMTVLDEPPGCSPEATKLVFY